MVGIRMLYVAVGIFLKRTMMLLMTTRELLIIGSLLLMAGRLLF